MEDQNYLEGQLFIVGLVGVILEGLQWHSGTPICLSTAQMTSLVGDPQLLLLLGNHYLPNMTSSIFPIKSFSPL